MDWIELSRWVAGSLASALTAWLLKWLWSCARNRKPRVSGYGGNHQAAQHKTVEPQQGFYDHLLVPHYAPSVVDHGDLSGLTDDDHGFTVTTGTGLTTGTFAVEPGMVYGYDPTAGTPIISYNSNANCGTVTL